MSLSRNGSSSNMQPSSSISSQGRRNALREAVKMLRTDWVREHLMGDSSTTEAGILSSPLQQLHSVPFESGMHVNPHSATGTDCNVYASSEMVIVPAFSKDGMSAAYILAETYGLYSEKLIMGQNGRSINRFITNEDNGNYIGVVRRSHADVITQYTRSTGGSAVHFFAFPKDTLHPLINDDCTDVSVLEKAVHSVFCAEVSELCSNCGINCNQTCLSSIRFVRPNSPLDLSTVAHNTVQTHIGRIYKNVTYELFKNGISKKVIPIDLQYEITQMSKQGVMKELLNWSIGKSLDNPSIGATFDLHLSFANFNPNSSYPSNIASDDIPNETDNPSHFSLGTFQNAATASTIIPSTNGSTAIAAEVPPVFNDNSSFILDLSTNTRTIPITVPGAESGWFRNLAPAPVASGETSNIGGCHQNVGETSRSQFRSLPTPPVPQVQPVVPQMYATTPNRSVATRAIRIAPRDLEDGVRPETGEFNEEEMKKTAEKLRAWKKYQRKLSNRERAARSNRARKLRRQKEKETSQ